MKPYIRDLVKWATDNAARIQRVTAHGSPTLGYEFTYDDGTTAFAGDIETLWIITANKRSPQYTIKQLTIALADAIRCPLGVVPASAEGLVSDADLDAAEARRVAGV